jgi:hypothetical protein
MFYFVLKAVDIITKLILLTAQNKLWWISLGVAGQSMRIDK